MSLGSDFSGVDDLDWALSTVSGRTALAQALLRRYRTRKGELVTDANYGYALRDQIGATSSIVEVQQEMTAQAFEEEEVLDADVDVQITNSTIFATVRIVDGEGPFNLTLTATSLTLEALINNSPFWSEVIAV